MRKQRPIKKKAAFTLIEIMIALSIIGMLAALAIPSFLKARREARISRMISDLRIMCDAFALYAMENGSYPQSWGAAPDPVKIYLENARWDKPTPLGGRWLYYSVWGTYLIVVNDVPLSGGPNPIAPVEDWREIDKRVDDGNLLTGYLRLASGVQMQYSLDETPPPW